MTFDICEPEVAFAARTDTGKVRKRNEDAIEVGYRHGIAVLADGMGGYNAGDVASSVAVATIKDSLERHLPVAARIRIRRMREKKIRRLLIEAIEQANSAIYAVAQDNSQYRGMGTTVVAVVFHHDKVVVAHVGDSRLYRWRGNELTLLTRDHSLMQERIDAGLINAETARFLPNRNLITRALGVATHVDIEIHEHTAAAGDIYLLCSDGLSDMLSHDDMADVLAAHGDDIDMATDTLVDRANMKGGRDNTSVILAKTKSLTPRSVGRLLERLLIRRRGTG